MRWKVLLVLGLLAWGVRSLYGDAWPPDVSIRPAAADPEPPGSPVVHCVFPGDGSRDTFLRLEACIARGGQRGESGWARGS